MQFPRKSNLFSFQSVFWYLLLAAASFLILPPQVAYYLVPAILVSAKIWEKVEDTRRLNQESEEKIWLVNHALAGDLAALMRLQKKQISLSAKQQIEVLIQAHEKNQSDVINFFQQTGFKISFTEAYFALRDDANIISLLYFILDQFIDESSEVEISYLRSWLPFLIDHGHNIIDKFFRLNLKNVLLAIFELDEENVIEKNRLINLLDRNQILILKNMDILTSVMEQKNISAVLLTHFKPLFVSGQINPGLIIENIRSRCYLNSTKLPCSALLESVLEVLAVFPCKQQERNAYIITLLQIILKYQDIDRARQVLAYFPTVLIDSDAHHDFLRYLENPEMLNLLVLYGLDIKKGYANDPVLLESKLVGKAPVAKRQLFVEQCMRFNVDLKVPLREIPPYKVENTTGKSMTLLGYLPFSNLTIINHKAYEALRLQKFIAMFLEIKGISVAGDSLCVHEYMRDSQASWNYLLALYSTQVRDKEKSSVKLPDQIMDIFHSTLQRVYTQEGGFDCREIYAVYQAGLAIVLPVYLRGAMGEGHIAVMGVLKISPEYHLLIEADRGMGRNDFSIFICPSFDQCKLLRYVNTVDYPILLDKWHDHLYQYRVLFQQKLDKQPGDFCASISAKYVFPIAMILSLIKGEKIPQLKYGDLIEHLKKIMGDTVSMAQNWAQNNEAMLFEHMLSCYKAQDLEFINQDFLLSVEQTLQNNPASSVNAQGILPGKSQLKNAEFSCAK